MAEPCLDENTIVRMMDGALPDEARARVERHLDGCPHCASLVGEVARMRSHESGARHRGETTAEAVGTADTQFVTPSGHAQGTPRTPSGPVARIPSVPPASGPSVPPRSDEMPAGMGRYRILRQLGRGGMGNVYAAFDPTLQRTVALKVLRAEVMGEGAGTRLLHEARAMAKLSHPNVVGVHEVGEAAGRVYVAMEHVEGETLRAWLQKQPRSPDDVVAAFIEAAKGLSAAHGAGIVHRDFKPDNVMVDLHGRVRVTDFGLASAAQRDVALERGVIAGTPAYMAPEQWLGGAVGPAADQFALCVALYEALYGVSPFKGDTARERLAQIVTGVPDVPESLGPAQWALPILLRGMSPRPEDRYGTVDELRAALTRDNERKASRAVGNNVTAAWVMTVVHWGLMLLVIAAYSSPAPPPAPAVRAAEGGAWEMLSLMIVTALCVAAFVWAPVGLFWAPANAIALGKRKPWAWRSTVAYAWLSLFTLVGTPYGIYALYSLSRPGVRSLFEPLDPR